jgi:hypothetical protein
VLPASVRSGTVISLPEYGTDSMRPPAFESGTNSGNGDQLAAAAIAPPAPWL